MITNLAADVEAFTSNAFLVEGKRSVLVDTGANFDVPSRVRDRGIDVEAVLVTHTHDDHIGNLSAVTDAFDVPAWGFDGGHDAIDRKIEDGAAVRIGDHGYDAIHTPGHRDDHLCFYSSDARTLFSGDLVFQNGSFGRTDLPGGDRGQLVDSLDKLLEAVDPELEALYPGHGPSVTGDAYQHVELARRFAEQL